MPAAARHPPVLFASDGQLGPVPGQFSAASQAPADARHTVVAGVKARGGHAAPVPSHVSALSQAPAAGRQMKAPPALVKPSGGHAGPLPVQFSATSHGPATGRQTTLEDAKPSGGHAAPEPVQFSATSQAPDTGRHSTVAGWNASAGHTVLVPVQFSATSQEPAAGRQTAPAFPAACWQASLDPSHSSVLHGLPSSVHAVPAALFASAGQLALDPVQFSAGSHSPPDGRQTVLGGSKASAGQTVLVPVQFSSTSQPPAAARQTVPAFPAGCWQASFVPSHSSVLHGLPSSVHAVPAGSFASAGHVALAPVPLSAGSHSPPAGRQAGA